MGKKLLPALLALLLLTACGGGVSSGGPASSVPDALEATPEPAMESTPEPAPEPTSSVVWQVQTDYSRYTPYAPPEAQYTRLREEWIGDLEPSDDYGMLYPFVGTRLYSSYNQAISESGALYGLFDESGRVVADPVYTEVELAGYYDSNGGRTVTVPMLLLGRGDGDRLLYAIATPDGSFVTDCRYGYVRATAFGVLCAASYEAEEFVLYGFDGRVLLTEKDLKLGDSKLLWGASSLTGGDSNLLLAELDGGNYFLNLNGELVCGPYESADIFSGGYASIWENGKVGVIDTSGNWVIPPAYRSVSRGHDGAFIVRSVDSSAVCSSAGEEIFRAEGVLSMTYYGYVSDDVCYLKDGSVAAFSGQGWIDRGGPDACSPHLTRTTAEGNTELMDCRSGRTLTLEGEYYVSAIWENWVMGPVSTLEYLYCWADPPLNLPGLVVSWDLERTLSLENAAELGMGGVSAMRDQVTGEEYLVTYEPDGTRTVYTAELEPVLTSRKSDVSIYNGRVIITDDKSCTCTDLEGNVLFRYPLILPSGD